MGVEALRIFEQALTLSETEPAELAAKRLASLEEASDPDAEEARAAEIIKRAESVARGEAKLAREIAVVDRHELAAGKLAAFVARNASRDIFDARDP